MRLSYGVKERAPESGHVVASHSNRTVRVMAFATVSLSLKRRTPRKTNTSPLPILLITRRGEGHGVSSSFSQRVGNTGAEPGFLAEELCLAPAESRS
jgi:hypothetical protein